MAMPSSARRGGPTPCCCSTAAGAARRSRRRLISATRVGGWRKTDVADGLEGLRRLEGGGNASSLSAEREAQPKAWIAETSPRSTNVVGASIAKEFGDVTESRSGLIAMLHRLGFEHRKPETIGRTPRSPGAARSFSIHSAPARPCCSWRRCILRTRRDRSVARAPAEANLAIEQTG